LHTLCRSRRRDELYEYEEPEEIEGQQATKCYFLVLY